MAHVNEHVELQHLQELALKALQLPQRDSSDLCNHLQPAEALFDVLLREKQRAKNGPRGMKRERSYLWAL